MVPKLRFPLFHSQWDAVSLGDIIKIKSGQGFKAEEYSKSQNINKVRLLQIENVGYGTTKWTDNVKYLPDDYLSSYKEFTLEKGDVVLALNRPVTNNQLKITTLKSEDVPSILYQRVGKFIFLEKGICEQFYYQMFQEKIKNFVLVNSIGSDQPFISLTTLYRHEVYSTKLCEQTKIADFLSSVDEKITLLNKQYDLLCQYKKGMMQKIFSQEVRFKDENGEGYPEWKYVDLKEIASKVNIKNREGLINVVLTNSATQGIVRQDSYFEREIVTESNLQGYYVVSVGDFIYNPRISATAPVGPIKMNELIQGVMSPLYTAFRFKKGLLKFYQYFFESSVWHDYMKSVANSGARHDRMNISGADFFALPVSQPIEAEQSKIANFLSAIDEKISAKKAELDKLKNWKQGLLQQMFI
ncbi:restriction endonuclease subunit S [Citrobacter sp. Cf120]|uniref:restriction endonuclease subunit S n=1 Tax=Citrobacter sp. Cf120 TaxID=2985070 RepID=UPI002575EFAC|nr:restriction endonuclease subunit S [Citrobacter sp. Cf120]MDM3141993.1 restriction endonuclease subunit S [Citrobacter sp. Cf120]